MSVHDATASGTITLKFTTDLPHGPYVTQQAQKSFDVFINQNGSTLLDVKHTMEKFAAGVLAQQARNVTGHMDASWTVESFSYKGGSSGFHTSLEHMKNGDQLSFTFHQRISNSPCVIL